MMYILLYLAIGIIVSAINVNYYTGWSIGWNFDRVAGVILWPFLLVWLLLVGAVKIVENLLP